MEFKTTNWHEITVTYCGYLIIYYILYIIYYILYIISSTTYDANVVKLIIKLNYQINSQSRITYLELFGCEWNVGQDRSPRQIVVECVKKSKVFVSFFLLKSWSLYFCFRHFFLFVNLNWKVVFSNGVTNKYFYKLGNFQTKKSIVDKLSYFTFLIKYRNTKFHNYLYRETITWSNFTWHFQLIKSFC